jgi:hypothetical protein
MISPAHSYIPAWLVVVAGWLPPQIKCQRSAMRMATKAIAAVITTVISSSFAQ